MYEFKINELVYYDSLRGLVKGKIIDKYWANDFTLTPSSLKFTIQVTSLNHSVYRKGDIIETSYNWVIPRKAVYISSGQYRIKAY